MPKHVVKPIKDEDFYVVWSTVTDTPDMWGSRERMLSRRIDPERLDRADARGTSAFDGSEGYDAEEFWVANLGEQPFWVSRRDMRAFLESLHIHGSLSSATWDTSLTRPWSPDDDD